MAVNPATTSVLGMIMLCKEIAARLRQLAEDCRARAETAASEEQRKIWGETAAECDARAGLFEQAGEVTSGSVPMPVTGRHATGSVRHRWAALRRHRNVSRDAPP